MSEKLNFDEYQEATKTTAIYPRGRCADERLPEVGVLYCSLGLTGEAGEVSEKVKKYIREGDEEYLEELKKEAGDTLWYLARLCDEMGWGLSEVANENLEKLSSRQERGVIGGEGDDR